MKLDKKYAFKTMGNFIRFNLGGSQGILNLKSAMFKHLNEEGREIEIKIASDKVPTFFFVRRGLHDDTIT